MELYHTVSPLDYRYYGADELFYARFVPFVSEAANIKYMLAVEVALVQTMAEWDICPADLPKQIEQAAKTVTPGEVCEEEKRCQHNVRALVRCLQAKLSSKAKPYIHLFATSADIMDTAAAMRYRDLMLQALLPMLRELEQKLISLARKYSGSPEVGRTHGQHAVPITFGFALSGYVSRLGGRIEALGRAVAELRGQLSGAVGAYNSLGLIRDECGVEPLEFERRALSRLGLKPAGSSTQICEPEYVADLAYTATSTFSVLADLADDLRHLMRSEIKEIKDNLGESRVGSSTMPHKINPKDFENIKSLWKTFMPRMCTVFMDQLSEHQRDLTNSASSRFLMELFVGLAYAAYRLNKSLEDIGFDEQAAARNLRQDKSWWIAEALYTLLAVHGYEDAYEDTRRLVHQARKQGVTLVDLALADEKLKPYLDKCTPGQRQILLNPEQYLGLAKERAEGIADYWENKLGSAAED